MPAVIPFIPLIASGVGAVGGAISNRNKAKKQEKAMAADAPIRALQLQQAQQQAKQGEQLFNFGMPLLQRSGDYYGRLLSGDRAMLRSAVDPERREITDIYRGAESNLDRSGVRGAARDVASGNLARDKAGRLAGLMPQARAAAAGAAGNLGQFGASGGQSGAAGAGAQFSDVQQGSLNRQQLQFTQGEANANRSAQFGEDVGGMLTDFIKAWQGRGSGAGTASTYGGGAYTNPALTAGQNSAFGGLTFGKP